MIPGEEKGEISNEFFKKLNQQIVQKDNLIKLLQLQIKNLKAQVEESTTDTQKKGELSKTLETKEAEIKRLETELAGQKAQLTANLKERDDKIQSLNQLLEENRKASSPETASLVDKHVADLEAAAQKLETELEAERKAKQAVEIDLETIKRVSEEDIGKLQIELENVKNATANEDAFKNEISRLESEIKNREADLTRMASEIAEANAKIEQLTQASLQANEISGKSKELEQDLETLRALLAEKDEQMSALSSQGKVVVPDPLLTQELQNLKTEYQTLQSKFDELSPRALQAEELRKQAEKLTEENLQIPQLKEKLGRLEIESSAMAEASLKLTVLEGEQEKLIAELDALKSKPAISSDQVDSLRTQLDNATRRLNQRDTEIADLRANLDSQRDKSLEDPTVRAEIEQLTGQVADQLLAIQKFEEMMRRTQEELTTKEEEIIGLRQQLDNAGSATKPIPISGESEVISSFIDFFDGLDQLLVKNPLPELQSLHKKLLDRLIIPNEIHYIPVISEEYNSNVHIATDYFRSTKFPEKCIVFEVEKGYRKGDAVIKKSKVWVVQNLFNCRSCQSLQSNSDSRFCHMCGQKIVAPNGLPADSLPIFEPTPTTYLRFAERMIEQNFLQKAKDYLREGMALDPENTPIMVRLADVHSLVSEFPEAIDLLKRAEAIKPDPKVTAKINALDVRNNIFQQARTLNLPPEEFEKLMNLIQK